MITLDELLRERLSANEETFRRRATIVEGRIDEINRGESDLTQLAHFLKQKTSDKRAGRKDRGSGVRLTKDVDRKTRFV